MLVQSWHQNLTWLLCFLFISPLFLSLSHTLSICPFHILVKWCLNICITEYIVLLFSWHQQHLTKAGQRPPSVLCIDPLDRSHVIVSVWMGFNCYSKWSKGICKVKVFANILIPHCVTQVMATVYQNKLVGWQFWWQQSSNEILNTLTSGCMLWAMLS